jgi:PRTRC genetic system protein C
MNDQNSIQKSTPARRVFRYSDHEFDDPGREYTVDVAQRPLRDQVRQALLPYFPELAHATADEKTLEDGTQQITFRKQVTRKGNDILELAIRLESLPRYTDPVTELQERLGLRGTGAPQTCTLQILLDHRDEIEVVAGQIQDRATRTETMVRKCWKLPPSAVTQIPQGF